jgi:two-component system response regulator AtoC
VLLADDAAIQLDDLPPEIRGSRPGVDAALEADEDLSIKRRLASLERDLIERALRRTEGNRSQAARILDISYKALVYKIRDYGLES